MPTSPERTARVRKSGVAEEFVEIAVEFAVGKPLVQGVHHLLTQGGFPDVEFRFLVEDVETGRFLLPFQRFFWM